MPLFLANENVPRAAVEAARQGGHDLTWMAELAPGSGDEVVLAAAQAEGRVLVTFDKDFGELAFRRGLRAVRGVVLLRPRLRDPDYLAWFLLAVLRQGLAWEGHFTVAREGSIRSVPLAP